MYTVTNFKTKKALKETLAVHPLEVFAPGFGTVPQDGTVYLEGPHYPAAHTWYAEGTMKDGKLVKVK